MLVDLNCGWMDGFEKFSEKNFFLVCLRRQKPLNKPLLDGQPLALTGWVDKKELTEIISCLISS